MNPVCEAALAHARRGLRVFPLRPNTKLPAIKAFSQFATTDETVIRSWFDKPDPPNIGISTDYELVVPDMDPRHGGVATLCQLRLIEDIPDTLIARSYRGGAHLFFKLPPGMQLKGGNNKLGPGLDVKARGGYVVAAGSTIDGKPYEWVNDLPIAMAPQWLIDRCQRARTERSADAGKQLIEEDEEAVRNATEYMHNEAPEVYEGNRDNKAYEIACRIYEEGVALETVRELLNEWNCIKCFPPLDDSDIERIAGSAKRSMQKPIGIRHPIVQERGFEAVPNFDESQNPNKKPVLHQTAVQPTGALEWFADAAKKALSEIGDPLIEGIWECDTFIVTYGESGGGKTFLVLDQAYCVATGRPWLGKYKVKRSAVLYIALEGGKGIDKRCEVLRQRYPEDKDVPLFVVKASLDLLRNHDHGQQIVQWCAEAAKLSGLKVEMIVIDTLSRAFNGGDENSPTDMGVYVGIIDKLRLATGAAINTVHHTGKDKTKGARGHSLLRAAADTEIEVNDKRWAVRKQRNGEETKPAGFRLVSKPIGVDPTGRRVTSCIVEPRSGGAEHTIEPTPTERQVLDAIDAADTGRAIFSVEDVAEYVAKQAAKRQAEDPDKKPDKLFARSTLVGHCRVLSDKGWLEYTEPNQYVRVVGFLSGSVGE